MSATTAALAAFNLICTVQALFFDQKKQEGDSFPIEYRIDLREGRFCVGGCLETRPIARVTDTDLFLVADRDEDGGNTEFIKISRESGGYIWILGDRSGEIRTVGRCERTAFSGFPSLKF